MKNLFNALLCITLIPALIQCQQSCVPNDPDAELDWTESSPGLRETMALSTLTISATDEEQTTFLCCATGANSVKWYINGTTLEESEDGVLEIEDDGMRLEYLKPMIGQTNATCVVTKNDFEELRFEYELRVRKACSRAVPTYTVEPEDVCAKAGEDVVIECSVSYDEDICIRSSSRKVVFVFGNFTSIDDAIPLVLDPLIQVEQIRIDEPVRGALARATFENIKPEYLNRDYACLPFGYFNEFRSFRIIRGKGQCQNSNDETSQESESVDDSQSSEESQSESSDDSQSNEDKDTFNYIKIANTLKKYAKIYLPHKNHFTRQLIPLDPLFIVLSHDSVKNHQYQAAITDAIESKLPLVFVLFGDMTKYMTQNPAVKAAVQANPVLQYPNHFTPSSLKVLRKFLPRPLHSTR